MSSTTTRQAEPDQACADAADLARAAAEEVAGPGQVGPHVGIEVDSDRVVTHLFACLSPAYVGWRWAVTVSRAARARAVTVSESVLLPGADSLLAPPWVPWTERVRPGDLKAGDLMPASADDDRLVPVVAIAGDAGLLDWDENDAWRLGVGAGTEQAGEAVADGGEPGRAADAEAGETPAARGETPAAGGESAGAAADVAGGEPAGAGGESAGAGGEAAGAGGIGAAGGPAAGSGQPGAAPIPAGTSQAAPPQRASAQVAPPAARDDGPKAEPGGRGRGRRRGGARARSQPVGMLRPTRVLSASGRDEAAARWYAGDHGPRSALASAAPASCMTCGFMVRLSGPLGRVFGVCSNGYAPDDGKVVSVDHGCGAHSEGEAGALAPAADAAAPTVDELGYDMITTGSAMPESVLETLDHELL